MEITAQDFDQDLQGDAAVKLAGKVEPGQEDSYWQNAFAHERYFTPGLDYEDYAPAYCVGYIGQAQYGGSFEDAEKSLCANWERIRGDSRLSMDAALLAMRAAWDRMANRGAREHARKAIATTLMRRRMRVPSFKLSPMQLR